MHCYKQIDYIVDQYYIIGLVSNFRQKSKQLSEIMQVYIATITGMLDVQLHYNPLIAGAIEMKNTAALQTFLSLNLQYMT